jgi:hypothetical protein
MSTERPVPMDRVHLLNPGQALDVGDRRLLGFRPPLFDNPATVGFFDEHSGACFTSDCFGAPMPTADLAAADAVADAAADDLRTAQLLWATIDSPWVHRVDRTKYAASFDPLRTFDASCVLSTHLPPVEGNAGALVETLLVAPDAPEFVGPDQAALEALLAEFDPA